MKKILIISAILLVASVAAVMLVARLFFPDNVAETAPDGGKKGLKTLYYKSDLENAVKDVEEIIPALSGWGSDWKLVGSRIEGDSAVVKAEIPVVFFTDDLEIRIKETENEGEVSVDVRSSSRVGKSDFGENRRHVAKFLRAMGRKILKFGDM